MALKIENPVETAIGAAVLAAAIGFGVYASQTSGADAASDDRYEVVAKFRSANGLATGADVRVAGVKVGRVESMILDPATYKAKVVLSVDKAVELTTDAIAKIDTEGLLGGTFVDIDPGGAEKVIAEGGTIKNTQGAVSLLELLAAFASSDSEAK